MTLDLDSLEWFAAFWGVLGSILIAARFRYSAWGFPCYAVSNLSWMWFGVQHALPGVVAMNVVFFCTTVFGVWRWFQAPAEVS